MTLSLSLSNAFSVLFCHPLYLIIIAIYYSTTLLFPLPDLAGRWLDGADGGGEMKLESQTVSEGFTSISKCMYSFQTSTGTRSTRKLVLLHLPASLIVSNLTRGASPGQRLKGFTHSEFPKNELFEIEEVIQLTGKCDVGKVSELHERKKGGGGEDRERKDEIVNLKI